MTSLDLRVVLGLAALAALLWLARRPLRWLLRFVPAGAILVGFAAAYACYQAGDQMNWDSPGSPAILIVVAALGASVLLGLAGLIALGLQVYFWRSRRAGDGISVETRVALGNLGVLCIITGVVTSLWRAYEFRKDAEPSHRSSVAALTFSGDARHLYSLDEHGVLKRWDLARHREAAHWQLDATPNPEAVFVSRDEQWVLVLDRGSLVRFDLRSPTPSGSRWAGPGIREAWGSSGHGGGFLIGDDVWAFDFESAAPRPLEPRAPWRVATAAAAGASGWAIATRDGELAFAGVDGRYLVPASDLPVVQLGFEATRIRSDRGGRRLLVAGGDDRVLLVDAERMDQVPLPNLLSSGRFEITHRGRGLFLTLAEMRAYDVAAREFLTSFSHGSAVTALAVSPTSDEFAVSIKNQVFHCQDTYNYVSETEVRLRGVLEF